MANGPEEQRTERRWNTTGYGGDPSYEPRMVREVKKRNGQWYSEEEISTWEAADRMNALQSQLEALRLRCAGLEQKAALADEEWGHGSEEDYLDLTTWGEMHWTREICTVCQEHQEGDNVGRRPFPHHPTCIKRRYDALQPQPTPQAQP